MLGLEAAVSHPSWTGSYAVDDYGRPMLLPGMSGVVANVRVGDPVFPWAADHLEPGVSAGNDDRRRHQALQFLACLGNTVRVVGGPAAGAEGTVVGKHAFVLVDFPQAALDALAPGDRLLVRAHGQGLRLSEFPEIVTRSLSPSLLRALPLQRTGDARLIGVVAHGGYGGIPGHGTGVVTIMSGPSEQFEPVRVERANVRDYLDLPE